MSLPPQATEYWEGRVEVDQGEEAYPDMLGEVKQERKEEFREKLLGDLVGISQSGLVSLVWSCVAEKFQYCLQGASP